MAHPGTAAVFALSSPKRAAGEASVENKSPLGWGEEAQLFPAQFPSPRPSPSPPGEEREMGAESGCARLGLIRVMDFPHMHATRQPQADETEDDGEPAELVEVDQLSTG